MYIARKRKMNLLKMGRPCYDCGGMFSLAAMEWDHARGVKGFNIATGLNRPLEEVVDEIAKCDLVCANCHRVRTASRNTRYAPFTIPS